MLPKNSEKNNNTDTSFELRQKAQEKRKRDAVQSAVVSSAILSLQAIVLLGLRWYYQIEGIGSAILLIVGLLELGMVIPVLILLRKRLKEIEGGEEDDAAQY